MLCLLVSASLSWYLQRLNRPGEVFSNPSRIYLYKPPGIYGICLRATTLSQIEKEEERRKVGNIQLDKMLTVCINKNKDNTETVYPIKQ